MITLEYIKKPGGYTVTIDVDSREAPVPWNDEPTVESLRVLNKAVLQTGCVHIKMQNSEGVVPRGLQASDMSRSIMGRADTLNQCQSC